MRVNVTLGPADGIDVDYRLSQSQSVIHYICSTSRPFGRFAVPHRHNAVDQLANALSGIQERLFISLSCPKAFDASGAVFEIKEMR